TSTSERSGTPASSWLGSTSWLMPTWWHLAPAHVRRRPPRTGPTAPQGPPDRSVEAVPRQRPAELALLVGQVRQQRVGQQVHAVRELPQRPASVLAVGVLVRQGNQRAVQTVE